MTKRSNGTAPRGGIVRKIREIIGRAAPNVRLWAAFQSASMDETRPDYAFWDRFRRGQAKGFEFAGLFARPIAQIVTSWVIGQSLDPRLDPAPDAALPEENVEHTNRLLKKLVNRAHSWFISLIEDLYSLGDQYVVVNLDGSLTSISPELVEVERDPLDRNNAIAYTITTRSDKATIIDKYTLEGRTLSIKQGSADPVVTTFENLIDRIPIVHLTNDKGVNETNGRPIFEALYSLFAHYNRLLLKMLNGAELMGNPIPVFEGLEDIDETIAANAEPTDEMYTDEDGNARNRVRISFDRLAALFLGKGGNFKFAAPPSGFTNDVRNSLKSLFMLILEFTRIPEVVWGNELSSARASAGEQMKTFYMFVEARRVALEGWGADDELEWTATGGLLAIFDIWLRVRALTDPRIIIAPVAVTWPELSEINEELRLKWAELLHGKGVLTDVTLVKQSGLVDDAEAEVEQAADEVDARQDPYERAVDDLLNATNNASNNAPAPEEDEEEGELVA